MPTQNDAYFLIAEQQLEIRELEEKIIKLKKEYDELHEFGKNMQNNVLKNANMAAQKAVNYLDHFTDFIPMGETYLKTINEEGELGYEIQGYLNHLNDEHGFMPNDDKHF